ncbi:alpha/beta hydrolase [Emcibacter sp.]|uniref:alpha/beta hydrolase n=1 Tax=Emcibacter sp. TaxID=1979954 RepID=UPI003A93D691
MSKNTIRPDVQVLLDLLSTTPLARLGELSVEETRAISKQMRPPLLEQSLVSVRDISFTHPGGEIGLRCYNTEDRGVPTPLILYFHGGGFVLGDLDSHHELCLTIAHDLDLPLVSVDYRLAPENPWPAAPDDAETAARWIATNASNVLGLRLTGLVLAGDSAGGNLAAVTARALTDKPVDTPLIGQFLIYPCVSVVEETRSRQENAEGYYLTRKVLDWFTAQYDAPADDPRFNLFAFDQTGMPPTLLVTAGLDPLRDEGRAYAARLIEAGVPVVYQEAVGNIHGCFSMAAAIPSTKRDVDRALAALDVLIS